MSCPGQNSLFGASDKYIKFLGGDAVAIEGPSLVEKQILNDLRFPYEQILRSRVTLKAGQVNYLLNFLGLGDNATFLSISARYSPNSKIPDDNYIKYNYYPDLTNSFYFAQMLLLTGNTTNRVPQLYLTNPNSKYPVTLDVMVAIIDDTYTFFDDTINQSGLSFTNLLYTYINTFIVNESIVILDDDANALCYLTLAGISSIDIVGNIVIIKENAIGSLFLEFIDEANAKLGNSVLNYIKNNNNVVVDANNPYFDSTPPVVYFYEWVGNNSINAPIDMLGATGPGPYDTGMNGTSSSSFGTTVSFGTYSQYSKMDLIGLLINQVQDNRDNLINIDDNNINLVGITGSTAGVAAFVGTYSMTFNITDLAGNIVNTNTNLQLILTA